MKTLAQLGEFDFIRSITPKHLKNKSIIKAIGDDAAVIRIDKENCLVFTADMLIEGIHFLKNAKPSLIGNKALSCSISDIAAMGAMPLYAVISVAFPKHLSAGNAKEIYQGIRKTADNFGVDIIGGDTNSADKIIIDVFLCGKARKKQLVYRNGAKAGDRIFVTGTLGGSIKGRHLRFVPRMEESKFLVSNFKLNSMIDISDGLIADLGHILEQSKKGAVLKEGNIPLSKDASGISNAFYDGEDFELLFTLDQRQAEKLIKKWPFKKTRLSCIGEITNKSGQLVLETEKGKIKKIKVGGYKHF
jgi:thiamine-monophosphate kinase